MSPWKLFASALAAVMAAGMLAVPVQAHHAIATFDHLNRVTVSGTVKEFRFGNPHTRIDLLVSDGAGGEVEWELEGGAVTSISREGWTSSTLAPGMKVKLLVAPRIDGRPGGWWLRLLEIDGQPALQPGSR